MLLFKKAWAFIASSLLGWLLLVFAVTAFAGLIYVTVQQDMRQGANDPQIQVAEDTATALVGGQTPASFATGQVVDVRSSLAPFLVIFDNNQAPVATTGKLDGVAPTVPAGVFDFVQKHGEERFSWEPKTDVRIAVVMKRYNNGYVLAGRSLREVEKREDRLTWEVIAGWFFILTGASFFYGLRAILLVTAKWQKSQ